MLFEYLLVGTLVAGCALFSTWRLLSVRARLRVLELLAALPGNPGGRWLTAKRQRLLAGFAGGCGSCPQNAVNAPSRAASRRSAAPHR